TLHEGDRQALAAEGGLRKIIAGGLRKLRLEQRRRRTLRQRGHRRRRGGRVFWPDNLGIAVVRQHVVLVLPIARIGQKIKSAVSVLHFRQIIRLPFRLLQKVAPSVAAFGE